MSFVVDNDYQTNLLFKKFVGVAAARLEDEFSVKVITANSIDHGQNIKTPYWSLPNTNEHSCPRDTFSIIGNPKAAVLPVPV